MAHLPAGDHLSKDGVVTIQVRRGPHEDGKVALVGVGPQIGRAQQALAVMRGVSVERQGERASVWRKLSTTHCCK